MIKFADDFSRPVFQAVRLLTLCAFIAACAILPSRALAQSAPSAPQAAPERIRTIQVVGNQRVEPNTVASYLLFSPGDPYSDERIDLSIKTLYATGLFADVLIEPNDGNVIIRVIENPIINRVVIEGNKAIKNDKITDEIQAAPRSVFTRSKVQADVQRIIELYRLSGRFAADVVPKVVQQPQNRVDLIFEISEGPVTGVKRINFIGNSEFSDKRLRKVTYTEESIWWKFFSSNDNYDPNRLEADREQLRSFYTDRGFADFRVSSAVAELTPDQKDFYITFTVDEGDEYRWGNIEVDTTLETLDESLLYNLINIESGDIYNASRVEDVIDNLTFAAGAAGYAFVDIKPLIKRNRDSKTVDLTFEVAEGPRVYIERIDIVGNTTTLDKVIRRQLAMVEGDAFNRLLMERSRSLVRRLGFFEDVEITETQGSAPDRALVEVKVSEQPTGELAFSAGISSNDRFIVDFTVTERNLRGRGQIMRFVIRATSNRREIDLRFTEPRFLGRNLAGGIELFSVQNDFLREAGFRSTFTGGSLTLGFPMTDNTALSARYTLRNEEVEVPGLNCAAILADPSAQAQNSLCLQEGNRLSSIVGYDFSWDNKNDAFTPTKGFDFRFGQDFAGVGGDVKYLRTDITANIYQGIFEDVIASAKFAGGYIQGWGGDAIRINDRYFGGTNYFRGYDNAGIGPRTLVIDNVTGEVIQRGNALGGNAFGVATAEVSFPLGIPGILGSLFVEGGTVGILDEEFKFDTAIGADGVRETTGTSTRSVDELTIRAMVGASIFWESPFGPIRFDFTQPLLKEEYDDRKSFQFTTRTRF